MKKHIFEFFRRGLMAAGFGPLFLAVLYLVLQSKGLIENLSVNQVSLGILSLFALAFVAGGLNIVYQLERLPLMWAILIHGAVLYLSYLAVFLLNDWLKIGPAPLLIFSGIFVGGYLLIWVVIYSFTKRKTRRLNEILRQKQALQ